MLRCCRVMMLLDHCIVPYYILMMALMEVISSLHIARPIFHHRQVLLTVRGVHKFGV